MMSELLPCPFCGGEANPPQKSGGGDERNGYNFLMTIRCRQCRASISRESSQDKSGWCNDSGQAEVLVIAAWQSRVAASAKEAK